MLNKDLLTKHPYINLLYAVLLQAVEDRNGYIQDGHIHDGNEAQQFLQTTGKIIYDYLKEVKYDKI